MKFDWLRDLVAEYSRREVDDLIAVFFLTLGFDPKTTSPFLLGLIDEFARRAGVEAGEDRAASQAKMRAYLEAHPIDPELKVTFEQSIRSSLAGKDATAMTDAFARFAATDLGKRAPDGGRPQGTRPGYLALMAHDDLE